MSVLVDIIGSSFVSRLDNFIKANEQLWNFGLDPDFARVAVHGIGGLTVPNLQCHDTRLAWQTPDIVILHCGANDLSRDKRPSLNVAIDLHDYAQHLRHDFHVDHVVMCSALKCYSVKEDGTLKFGISEDIFNDKVSQLNVHLSYLFDSPSLHFWDLASLQGLYTSVTGIDWWDGVHLNLSGMKKYYRELCGAIVTYAKPLQADPAVNY